MSHFADRSMKKMYDACRSFGADKNSSFYIQGKPHRGAGHRCAYWNGRNGLPSRWLKNSLAYAAWAAGRDDRRKDTKSRAQGR